MLPLLWTGKTETAVLHRFLLLPTSRRATKDTKEMTGRASGPINAGKEKKAEEKKKGKEAARVARKEERKAKAHAMLK